MSRDNSTYKESYNGALAYLAGLGVSAALPSEAELTHEWGTSRTTVRAVLARLDQTGIIRWSGRNKTVLRRPTRNDYFALEETISPSERVEARFMAHILGGDLKPGTLLRETELTREFGVSTSVIREFLIRFSRFGLIEKEPNRHWVLRGFTRQFAIEVFEVREMFETRAFGRILALGPHSEVRAVLVEMEADHQRIVDHIDSEYLNFPPLDEGFHHSIIGVLNNRFVDDFFELVSVIFHYHYRWNKRGEPVRNKYAAQQHLAIIRALAQDDDQAALGAFRSHLAEARKTLLDSIAWEGED